MTAHLIEEDENLYIDPEKFPDIPTESLPGYGPCRFSHPKTSSCLLGSFLYFFESLPRSYKLYIPFNLAVSLLFKRRFFPLTKFLTNYAISCTRSSLFLTLYSWITKSSICLLNYIGLNYLNRIGFPGFLCGASVLAERKSRRIELAMYCLPKGIQIVWNILKKKRGIKPIPNGEFLYIPIALGILFWLYQREEKSISSNHLALLKAILGVN